MPQPLYPEADCPQHTLNRRQNGLELVWMLWRGEKSLASIKNWTPGIKPVANQYNHSLISCGKTNNWNNDFLNKQRLDSGHVNKNNMPLHLPPSGINWTLGEGSRFKPHFSTLHIFCNNLIVIVSYTTFAIDFSSKFSFFTASSFFFCFSVPSAVLLDGSSCFELQKRVPVNLWNWHEGGCFELVILQMDKRKVSMFTYIRGQRKTILARTVHDSDFSISFLSW